MSFAIIWSPQAINDIQSIYNYILDKWGKHSAQNFINTIVEYVKILSLDIAKFTKSIHHKNLYKVVIHKNTTLVYKRNPYKRQIEIVSLWDNRQNPQKLKF